MWKTDLPSKDGEALSTSQSAIGNPNTYIDRLCSAVADSATQWFAAYTTARHEKHVAELLTERGIETFVPLYRSTREWKKSRPVVLDLPLFPTYVFVHIAQDARGGVLGIPGVLSIVGSAKEPWPLPDREIEVMRLGLAACRAEPHAYLTLGERVRIKAGVMAGLEGIVVRKKNEFRVVLTLDAIMRSIAVEIDACDLEPAQARPGSLHC